VAMILASLGKASWISQRSSFNRPRKHPEQPGLF
jgi:hypothetical protein